MKQYVRISWLGMIVLFFMSTTGVTIYKHYCNYAGEFYGVFADVNHDCEPEIAEHPPQCCCEKTSGQYGEEISEECCTSSVELYQLDTELIYHDMAVDFVNADIFISSFKPNFSLVKNSNIGVDYHSPPVFTTSKRLSLFQRYLI